MTTFVEIENTLGSPANTAAKPTPLLGHTRQELEALCASHGAPPYRGRQLASWIYGKGARRFDQMTDLPRDLRDRLARDTSIGRAQVTAAQAARDGTTKLLLQLADAKPIETVLLPYEDRTSVCISSQV